MFCKIVVLSNFWTSRFMVVFCLQRVPSWTQGDLLIDLGGMSVAGRHILGENGARWQSFPPKKNGRNWLGQKVGLKNNSRSIGMLAPRTSASPKGALGSFDSGRWCAFPDGLRCQGSALQLSRWRRDHHRNVLSGEPPPGGPPPGLPSSRLPQDPFRDLCGMG